MQTNISNTLQKYTRQAHHNAATTGFKRTVAAGGLCFRVAGLDDLHSTLAGFAGVDERLLLLLAPLGSQLSLNERAFLVGVDLCKNLVLVVFKFTLKHRQESTTKVVLVARCALPAFFCT